MRKILAIVVAGLMSGCIVYRTPDPEYTGYEYHYQPGPAYVVVVPAHHMHNANCGHYYYRDRWYYRAHHYHGPGCGHVYRGGRWLLVL